MHIYLVSYFLSKISSWKFSSSFYVVLFFRKIVVFSFKILFIFKIFLDAILYKTKKKKFLKMAILFKIPKILTLPLNSFRAISLQRREKLQYTTSCTQADAQSEQVSGAFQKSN